MKLNFRPTISKDFAACVKVRAATRDNPVPEQVLASLGITAETWGPLFDSGDIIGRVCEDASGIVGFCSGDAKTGEILVLAVLPDYEGLGAGKALLSKVVSQLAKLGFDRLWLAASPDPATRAHGFYRHCGWRPTGERDDRGDEILELV